MEAWRFTYYSGNIHTYLKGKYSLEETGWYKDLFCPPGHVFAQFSMEDLYILQAYLKDGSISVLREPAYKAKRRINGIKVKRRTVDEENHHIFLKKSATAWLQDEKGVGTVVYERGFQSGVCDVASEDGKWIVECGSTRPSKIYDTFLSMRGSEPLIVVFNHVGIAIFFPGPLIGEARKTEELVSGENFTKVAEKLRKAQEQDSP